MRGFAIVLVVVGHLFEKMCLSGSNLYCFPFRLIYSFHVPLFVFLAGVFHKRGVIRWKLINYYWGFALMSIPFWMMSGKDIHFIYEGLLSTLMGYPSLNWVSWFFLMLLGIEIATKVLEGNMRIAMYSSIITSILSINSKVVQDLPFFFEQAGALLPFYLTGVIMREFLMGEGMILQENWLLAMVGGIFIFGVATNPEAAVVAISQYGSSLGFFIMGAVGVMLTIGVFQRLWKINLLRIIGNKSLPFMFWAGMQFHLIDFFILGM